MVAGFLYLRVFCEREREGGGEGGRGRERGEGGREGERERGRVRGGRSRRERKGGAMSETR